LTLFRFRILFVMLMSIDVFIATHHSSMHKIKITSLSLMALYLRVTGPLGYKNRHLK